MDIEISVLKASIPILWLDSSVIAKMAKVHVGELREENDAHATHYESLYRLVFQKVRERKLLCPMGDQEEELLLGGRLVTECHQIQASLSLGTQFSHRNRIRLNQTLSMLKAFIHQQDQVQLDYRDAFSDDPVREIDMAGRFIVTVRPSVDCDETQIRMQSKRHTKDSVEEVRRAVKASGLSFEEQLELELRGEYRAWKRLLEAAASGDQGLTLDDFLVLEDLGVMLAVWARNGGSPAGLAGLDAFFSSEHYRAIPYVSIRSRLWARIVTSSAPVAPGDEMDVGQLSAVVPYSSFVLTDLKMRNNMRELHLDRQWKTTVCAMADYELLEAEISRL